MPSLPRGHLLIYLPPSPVFRNSLENAPFSICDLFPDSSRAMPREGCSSCDSQHLIEESDRILPHEVIDRKGDKEPEPDQKVWDADSLEPGDPVRADGQESTTHGGRRPYRCQRGRQEGAVETDGQMAVRPGPHIEDVPQAKRVGHHCHWENNDALYRNGDVEHKPGQNEHGQCHQQPQAGHHDACHIGTKIRVSVHTVLRSQVVEQYRNRSGKKYKPRDDRCEQSPVKPRYSGGACFEALQHRGPEITLHFSNSGTDRW